MEIFIIVSSLYYMCFSYNIDQTDLTSLESSEFSLLEWQYQNGTPKTTIISDCSTQLLRIDDQEIIKKQYQIKARQFTRIRMDLNLFFPNFVENTITIKLNSNIEYQHTFLLAGITTNAELCSDSSSQHYQLTLSLPLEPWYIRSVEFEIQYSQINPHTSSYLGIRDIHILTDSASNDDHCAYYFPLRSSDDNECVQECKSVGEQIGGSQLNRCISPFDTTDVQRIGPNWINNYNSDLLYSDPNYGDLIKFQLFDQSYNSASYIIKDSALFGSGHKIQVVTLLYLLGAWDNGSYLKFCVNNGGSSIELFQITSTGTAVTVSTGVSPYLFTQVLQDGSTIPAGRIIIVVEGQLGVSGTWEYGFKQKLLGSTSSYAIGNIAIYRAQQITQLCTTFVQPDYCISCIDPYYAYEGHCIKFCPTSSLVSIINRNCTSYIYTETTLRYPALIRNYIGVFSIAKFYNANDNSDDISNYFTSVPSTTSTLNYLNSQQFSIIQKKKLLGGYNSWGSGTYSKQLTGLSAHSQIRLFVTLYFIDHWYPTEKIIITIETTEYSESIEGLVGDLITGNPAFDYKKTVFYRLSHTSSTLTIKFQCKGETNGDASMSSCGISDLFLMLDTALSTSTVCTSATQYLDFYTNTCQNCDVSCNGIGCELFPQICKCDSTCLTCTGPLNSQCSTCNSQKHWIAGGSNNCDCDTSNNYEIAVIGQSTCSLNTGCHYSCQNCFVANSSTQCSKCPDETTTFRFMATNMECKCKSGYYDTGLLICEVELCHYSCATCSAYGIYNACLTCPDQLSTHRVLTENTCACESGFIDIEGQVTCSIQTTCHYSCGTCSVIGSALDCSQCLSHQVTHRTQNGSTCPCDAGYIQITNNSVCALICDSTCLTCTALGSSSCSSCDDSLNRVDGGNNDCVCKDGYHDISGSCQQITPCHVSCLLCSLVSSSNSCVSCDASSHRALNNSSQCLCDPGYEDNSNPLIGTCSLISCHYSCLTCSAPNSSTSCLTCPDPSTSYRLPMAANICSCQSNYAEVPGEVNCQPICHFTCETCSLPNSSTNCYTCPDQSTSHRIPGSNNDCPCESGYLSIPNQVNCQIQCHYSCLTCSLPNSFNSCLTCPDQSTSHRVLAINNYCLCQDNYTDILGQINCSPICHLTCQTCSMPQLQNSCLSCDTIVTHRTLAGNGQCLCQSQYQDPGNSPICSPICHSNCLTCNGILENECLTCDSTTHRVLIENECKCEGGYVEEGLLCLIQCQPLCLTCQSQQNCLSCKPQSNSLLIDNQCVCGFGQYANNDQCDDCPSQCMNCLNADICTECDINQQRVLINDQCRCESAFREVNGICTSCDLKDGWLSIDCIKINCNDGIFTFGEGCDDGNSDNRDGCAQCQVQIGFACQNTPLKPSICQKCSSNCKQCEFDSVCTKCESGYQIDRTGYCVPCGENCLECQSGKCITCKITLKNIQIISGLKECPLCEDQLGMYASPTDSSVCIAVCGDHIQEAELNEDCDDGNLLDNDGCSSTCKLEEGYDCSNQVCLKLIPPVPFLQEISSHTKTLTYYNPNRTYSLNYSLFIFDDNHLMDKIEFSIYNSTRNVDFFLTIDEFILNTSGNGYCNYSIIYQLQLLKSYESKLIEIDFNTISEIMSIQGAQQKLVKILIPITDYYYFSDEFIQTTQIFIDSNQIALYIFLVLVSVSLITGGLDIFWNLLDLIQLLSYIVYIDTRIPYNLSTYLEFFQFGQLNFLDNLFNLQSLLAYIIDTTELNEYQPKQHFEDYQSTLFLFNFCSILTTFIIIFSLYLLFRITSYICQLIQQNLKVDCLNAFNPQYILFRIIKKLSHYSQHFVDQFFYSALIRANMSIVYDLGFAIFLQFTEKYSNMKSIISKVSYILAVVALSLQLILAYFYSMKISEQYKQKQYLQKYGEALLDNLKCKKYCTISSYYNIFLLFKRFIYIFMLVVLIGEPQLQTITISIIFSINILFLFQKRPLNSKFEFCKQIQCEILMQLLHLQICLFTIDDVINLFGQEGRDIIGWICIGEISLILCIQLIIDIIQQIQYNYKNIQVLRKLIDKIFYYPKDKTIPVQKQRIFY